SSEFHMGMEYSPETLHGLSHREVGDFTDALAFEIEVPEPFLDRVRGVTDEKLLLEGKDEFVMKAGEHGLLYESIDENGWPIDERVGRTNSTIDMVITMFNEFEPGREIGYVNLPLRDEVVANGLGSYLLDPNSAAPDRVVFD
ncbi:MAG TPA: succinylglutamate desuccinylase, partial [Bacillota bacterium]|nr:succinylglutamate desuccinylase [Bacillota bacterium]